jgi:DNA repair exonuclease SbcCD ATPase subunit
VFRYWDKRESQSDKLLRFADKKRADMEGYFKKLQEGLDHARIDLETGMGRAVAAVKRFDQSQQHYQSLFEQLQPRFDELAGVKKNLETYGAEFSSLAEMTANLEENLARLHKETRTVDGLQKKLDIQQKKIDAVEADLNKKIAAAYNTAEAKLKAQSDSNDQTLRTLEEQAHTFTTDVTERFTTLYEESLGQAKQGAESRAEEYRARSEADAKNLEYELVRRIQEARTNLEAELEITQTGTAGRIAVLERDIAVAQAKVSEASEKLKTQSDSNDQTLRALEEQVRGFVADARDAFAALYEEKLGEARQNADGLAEEYRVRAVEDTRKLEDELACRIQAARTNLEAELKTTQTGTTERIAALERDITAAQAEVSAAAEKLKAQAGSNDQTLRVLEEQARNLAADVTERFATLYEESFGQAKQNAESRVEEYRARSEADAKNLEYELVRRIQEVRTNLEAELETTQIGTTERIAALERDITTAQTAMERDIAAAQAEVSEASVQFKVESDNNVQTLRAIEEQVRNFAADAKDTFTALYEEKLAEARQNAESQAEEYRTRFDAQLEQTWSQSEEKQGELRNLFFGELQTLRSDLERRLDQIRQFAVELEAVTQGDEGLLRDYEQKLKGHAESLDKFLVSAEKQIAGTGVELEEQLERYRADMDYRLKRLESLDIDVDQLEADLREAMSQAEGRVSADFTTFIQQQRLQQTESRAEADKNAEDMAAEMAQLEKSLEELKQRAYADVSTRFKTFEDDFLSDLSRRGDEITGELARWKNSFDIRLASIGSEYEDQWQVMESSQTDELKSRLFALQGKLQDQLARYEDAARKSEAALTERATDFETAVRGSIEQSQSRLTGMATEADARLKAELQSHTGTLKEELTNFEKDIQQKLASMTESVTGDQKKNKAVIEEMLSDFANWKERLAGQFEESRTLFTTRLATLDQNAGELLEQVQSAFKADVEAYSGKAVDERAKIEEQLRTMKALAQDIRGQNAAAQEQMVLKLQEESTNLNKIFDDLDKRLKNFITQSGIIGKADDTRERLEAAITTLRSDLAQTESWKPLIVELKQEYAKMQDMEVDATRKLAKFSGEQKRLEALEKDFNHLMALSTSMDEKITDLQAANDDMVQFEARIRKLNENLNGMDVKHERLDKKNDVLDRTLKDVDISFEKLKELEKRLEDYKLQADRLPGQMDGVMQDVGRVLSNRERIADSIKKLAEIERTLGDAETRMERIEKSRDIFARTETRLQELSKDAENQVKLFQSLVSVNTGKSAAAGDTGAPPINVREQVRELAHKGWKIDEIAKGLKLSIGQVELILELPPQ